MKNGLFLLLQNSSLPNTTTTEDGLLSNQCIIGNAYTKDSNLYNNTISISTIFSISSVNNQDSNTSKPEQSVSPTLQQQGVSVKACEN